MIIENTNMETSKYRIYPPQYGDQIGILYASRKDKYRVELGEYIADTPLMLIELIRRDKWW